MAAEADVQRKILELRLRMLKEQVQEGTPGVMDGGGAAPPPPHPSQGFLPPQPQWGG
eukprot:CAMPEP_0114149588 /NCGR_PEP_ID=MMETSP0043_2-20121206/22242_1 /TAXON_ID=464988 /ORGANISM="Hemiselmis andersenii, Strain CCMP644" /LENGTH=56 /DNA_ID=CAMNT_0001244247 /DNA_START=186 /DNA_END=352 /DNA_ORIENTATION=-